MYKKVCTLILLLNLFVFSLVQAKKVVFSNEGARTLANGSFVLDIQNYDQEVALKFGGNMNAFLRFDRLNDEFKINKNVNFENNEIKNARIEHFSATPLCDATQTGKLYFNTGDSKSYACNGTDWNQIDGGTNTVTGGSSPIPFLNTSSIYSMGVNSSRTITLLGQNFLPTTTVSIPTFDGSVSNVQVLSPNEMTVDIVAGTYQHDFDIVLSNNGVLNTEWTNNGKQALTVGPDNWRLFAITDSTGCAEQLPYGPNSIDENSTRYFSTALQNENHSEFKQIFTVNGTVLFEIIYDFGNTKTLKDRFDNATVNGETVNWTVYHQGNQYNYGPHLYFYSDGAALTTKWNTSGTNWGTDDGSWGAAPNNVDGNGGPYETWGHGNHNSGDNTCSTYYVNGVANTSTAIKSYMYLGG